jgi:hypothetical protein
MTKNTIDHMLQPLRIPAGWRIDYNIFTEAEATFENMGYFYGEWLLLASHAADKVGIELRYVPEGDPDGQFVLEHYRVQQVQSGQPNQVLIEEVLAKSKSDVVLAIERMMSTPTNLDVSSSKA